MARYIGTSDLTPKQELAVATPFSVWSLKVARGSLRGHFTPRTIKERTGDELNELQPVKLEVRSPQR